MEQEVLATNALAALLEVFYAPYAEAARKHKALKDIELLAAQLQRDLEKQTLVS